MMHLFPLVNPTDIPSRLRRALWRSCLLSAFVLAAFGASPLYAQDTIIGSDRLQPLNIPTTGPAYVSGVVEDPNDPAALERSPEPPDIVLEITPARDDGVTATSSDPNVVPNLDVNLHVFKFDNSDRWGLTITPIAPGETTITVQAGTAAYVIEYAASAASTTPATTRFHTGAQEASAAVGVNLDIGGGMWVADDEDNVLRLYSRDSSGLPLETADFTAQLGFDRADRVMDLEGSTRAGNVIYWISSHSNNSSGTERDWRQRLFSTTLSEDGYFLTFGSYDDSLRDDLGTWDDNNGSPLGLSASMVGNPNGSDRFNIEGLSMVPGSSTAAYIGFRAPLVPPNSRTNALIIPLNNIDTFVTGTAPDFGTPIQLDLGGKGIRSIECNTDACLIIAGQPADGGNFALYRWSGDPNDVTPELLATDLNSLGTTGGFENDQGSFESIVEVPNPLPVDVPSPVQLLLDNGDTRFYPGGEAYSNLHVNWRKFRSEQVLLVSSQPDNQPPNFTSTPVTAASVGQLYSYSVSADDTDPGDSLTLEMTSGPAWLSFATDGRGNGTLSGTPSAAGNYPVFLVAKDNHNASASQDFTVVVSPAEGGRAVTLEQRVVQSSDDAEEILSSDPVYLSSSDLEFTLDLNRAQANQTVGIRFGGLNIPRGATINSAYIEFVTDETGDEATSLRIDGEATDNSITFSTTPADISQRSRTSAFQVWDNVTPWLTSGAVHQTPELKDIVQEIVNRNNWTPGNALAFIITGTGRRVATSFDGSSAAAPLLHVEYAASADIVAYLPMLVSEKGAAQPSQNPIVSVDALWRYWDEGTQPDPSWIQLDGFDDTGWTVGAAPLGYGNDNEATLLEYGEDEANKHIAYYFRHFFVVDNPQALKALDLQLLRDDGAIVYLNGHEVVRSNMPTNVDTDETLALGAAVEDQYYHYTVDPSLLVAGRNLLAVEVHQAAPNSSDIAFALTLETTPQPVVRFAVIGDYGKDGKPEADVAALVKSWEPDFVITTGDNNYDTGAAETIDANIFNHYGEFITDDATTTRFFPSLGNHDWLTPGAAPYLARFALPGNERYYDFVRGDVHFFVIDSDKNEADGVSTESIQGKWLQDALADSEAKWKIVYFHHPPYSSGAHGSQTYMQWPFAQWGATVVLSGHEHNYERLYADGIPFFVNGLGGQNKRLCKVPTPLDVEGKSRICYDNDYGAMLVEATAESVTFNFIARDGALVDSCTLPDTCN